GAPGGCTAQQVGGRHGGQCQAARLGRAGRRATAGRSRLQPRGRGPSGARRRAPGSRHGAREHRPRLPAWLDHPPQPLGLDPLRLASLDARGARWRPRGGGGGLKRQPHAQENPGLRQIAFERGPASARCPAPGRPEPHLEEPVKRLTRLLTLALVLSVGPTTLVAAQLAPVGVELSAAPIMLAQAAAPLDLPTVGAVANVEAVELPAVPSWNPADWFNDAAVLGV